MMHDRERRPRQRLDDQREAASHVIAGAAVEPHAVVILACDDAKSVVLDFMQPQVAGGQLVGLCGKARRLSIAWLALAETLRVYREWMRRLAANACSSSAISFRALPGSRFSHRPRPQTRLVDRSWRTSAWPPHEPATDSSRY